MLPLEGWLIMIIRWVHLAFQQSPTTSVIQIQPAENGRALQSVTDCGHILCEWHLAIDVNRILSTEKRRHLARVGDGQYQRRYSVGIFCFPKDSNGVR